MTNDEDDDDIWFLEDTNEDTKDYNDDVIDTTLAIPLTNKELDYMVNCPRCGNYGSPNFKFRVEKYIKDGTTIIGIKCKTCGRIKTMEKQSENNNRTTKS